MSSHPSDSNGGAPTRIAILADVHGNLPAFEAVLGDARAEGVDAIWFLGDLVGYGAQPDECVALALEACDVVLAGNHDLAVAGEIPVSDFSPNAAAAVRWTQGHAGPETIDALRRLRPAHEGEPIGLYHGSPRDPIWEYVLSPNDAEECIDAMEPRIGAIGHTHIALRFMAGVDELLADQTPAGTEHDLADGRWLINPGSVGQPRDHDPRAAWMLLDVERWTARWERSDYAIAEAARAIADARLPRHLADRLFIGR
ncbi:MAG: metallophosphoesterase family protein [Thermoleophilaceae bacterium]